MEIQKNGITEEWKYEKMKIRKNGNRQGYFTLVINSNFGRFELG